MLVASANYKLCYSPSLLCCNVLPLNYKHPAGNTYTTYLLKALSPQQVFEPIHEFDQGRSDDQNTENKMSVQHCLGILGSFTNINIQRKHMQNKEWVHRIET